MSVPGKKSCLLLVIFLVSLTAFAESALPGDVLRAVLPNGLAVLANRTKGTPYVTVTMYVRGGAMAQTEKTAGIFRPLGFMTVREFAESGFVYGSFDIADEWTSYTIVTVPDRAESAAAALADVLLSRPFDVSAPDAETAVRSAESELADSSVAFDRAIANRLFAKYPWRKDRTGRPDLMRTFTGEDYASVRRLFVPRNVLVSVYGAMEPGQAKSICETAFGKLESGAEPLIPPKPFGRPSITRFQFVMYPDPDVRAGMGTIDIYYRGPGTMEDTVSAQAAFLWEKLLDVPGVSIRKAVNDAVPGLLSADSTRFSYVPRFDASVAVMSTEFAIDPKENAADRAQRYFKEAMKGTVLTEFHRSEKYVPPESLEKAKAAVVSDFAFLAGSAPGAFSDRYADIWAASDPVMAEVILDGVADRMMADVKKFVKDYIIATLEIVAVRVNPVDFEREKKPAQERRFEFPDEKSSVWWKK